MPPTQRPRKIRTNMLHFEFYSDGETHADIGVNSKNIYRRKRSDLADPLEILLEAHRNSFELAEQEKPNRVDIQNLRTSDKGIEFIKTFEDVKMSKGKHIAYDDNPTGPFQEPKISSNITIGYGHLVVRNKLISKVEEDVEIQLNGITRDELNNGIREVRAIELLKQDLAVAENGVKKHIKVPLSQNEFDALVSLSFNSGAEFLGNGGKSNGRDTLIKTLINHEDYYNGIDEISDVTNGNMPGLVKRRQAELTIFKSNHYATNIP